MDQHIRSTPFVLNQTWIWVIWRPGRHFQLSVTFLRQFLSSDPVMSGPHWMHEQSVCFTKHPALHSGVQPAKLPAPAVLHLHIQVVVFFSIMCMVPSKNRPKDALWRVMWTSHQQCFTAFFISAYNSTTVKRFGGHYFSDVLSLSLFLSLSHWINIILIIKGKLNRK